jgi:hypothetical protein
MNYLRVFFLIVFLPVLAAAQSQVTITADWTSPPKEISKEFSGVSYETKMMLPDGQGKYYFSAENKPLIAMFKLLGIKSLRVGGNSADNPDVKIPSTADIDSLFGFAAAADVHVIFNLRLKNLSDPSGDVQIVQYVMSHYRPLLTSFTIGNEPNVYFKEYSDYRQQLEKFMTALGNVPINAPSATPGKVAWAASVAKDLGKSGHIRLITQHAYPGGNALKVSDAAAGRTLLLAPALDQGYEKFYAAFVPAVLESGLPYRLEEANSLFHGGAPNLSNSFASALWGLDFMYWWATHDADGINFHTGDPNRADETSMPGGYDLFWTTPTGRKVHPIGYAIKAFDLGGHGLIVPVHVESKDQINLTAYGVKSPDGNFYVTIINRENGATARAVAVTLNAEDQYRNEQAIFLTAPHGDISITTGTTLGGATIEGDGTWNGKWTAVPLGHTVTVEAGSAAVVRFVNEAGAPDRR